MGEVLVRRGVAAWVRGGREGAGETLPAPSPPHSLLAAPPRRHRRSPAVARAVLQRAAPATAGEGQRWGWTTWLGWPWGSAGALSLASVESTSASEASSAGPACGCTRPWR